MALDVELREIRDFLAAHAPFDELPPEVLSALPARLAVEYFRRGSLLLGLRAEPAEVLVVRSGAVEARDADGVLVERGDAGTWVGADALVSEQPSELEVTALEDTLVLVLPADVLRELRAHEAVARHVAPGHGDRLQRAVAQQQASLVGDAVLRTTVGDLLRRAPVTVPRDATVRQAAEAMAAQRVSSLLVMDGGRLAGILTDRDLRTRVLAAGRDPGSSASDVMTPDPVTVTADSLALEVLLQMVERNIHHLPVLDGHRVAGMVTATDLLRLQHANPVYLVGDLGKADDPAQLAALGRRLGPVVEGLVAQDASAEDIGRVVTMVGDATERRLIELAEERYGAAPVPYAWMTLGSRARHEQSLLSDQDHALVLHDDAAAEHAAYFSDLAQFVSDGLLAAGHPLCRGDVMATNPRWRQPLAQWRRTFAGWLGRPEPEAVLRASIFFDLRHLHGDPGLTGALREQVVAAAPSARLFLLHLAKDATVQHPPLGFFRGLVVEKAGEHRDTLDIKRGGAGIVVKLARLHALSVGSPATNSRVRLADAVRAGDLSSAAGADLRDAWEYISYVRLRHQAAQMREGERPDNHVRPGDLSSFEKRHLREAFAVVRSAQQALAVRFPLHQVS